jgi:hypothetical protein
MSRKNKKALKNKVNNLLNPSKPFEKLIMDTIQTKYNEMLDNKLMNGSGDNVTILSSSLGNA